MVSFSCTKPKEILALLLVDIIGTIDYVLDDGTVVFQTCEEEKGKVIIQIVISNYPSSDRCLIYSFKGSSNPERAALAVKHVFVIENKMLLYY